MVLDMTNEWCCNELTLSGPYGSDSWGSPDSPLTLIPYVFPFMLFFPNYILLSLYLSLNECQVNLSVSLHWTWFLLQAKTEALSLFYDATCAPRNAQFPKCCCWHTSSKAMSNDLVVAALGRRVVACSDITSAWPWHAPPVSSQLSLSFFYASHIVDFIVDFWSFSKLSSLEIKEIKVSQIDCLPLFPQITVSGIPTDTRWIHRSLRF